MFVEQNDLEQLKTRAELLTTAIQTLHLPVSDDYLYEQLNIEKPADYDTLKAQQQEQMRLEAEARQAAAESDNDNGDNSTRSSSPVARSSSPTARNAHSPFFAQAPQQEGGAALEW